MQESLQYGGGVRTALALSAGGMFGAYQAGVWEALSEVFQPDIVVGASIGSLNGWLIAGGSSPSALVDRWLHLDSIQQIRWRFPKRLSDGFIDSALLEEWIQEMCLNCQPRSEYGAVLTELRTLTPRLFRWPDITWQHMAASCGVPGFLPQRRIAGTFYTDGGLVDPSPVWAAIDMGADVVVSVNVMNRRPPLLRAFAGAARAYCRYSPPMTEGCRVIDFDPIDGLGSAKDSMYWSRANAERWIDAGRRDALRYKHFLVECLEQKEAAA
jgi:NTE family protein